MTDDRLGEGRLTPEGVDVLAAGVEARRCALRELRVYDPPPPKRRRAAAQGAGSGAAGEQQDGSDGEAEDGEDSESSSSVSFETASSESTSEDEEGSGAQGGDGDDDGASSSSSEWEEVVLGQDDEVDKEAGKTVRCCRCGRAHALLFCSGVEGLTAVRTCCAACCNAD